MNSCETSDNQYVTQYIMDLSTPTNISCSLTPRHLQMTTVKGLNYCRGLLVWRDLSNGTLPQASVVVQSQSSDAVCDIDWL